MHIVSRAEAVDVCDLGQGAECCVWLVSSEKGLECSYHERHPQLLQRWQDGLTVAKRDGCVRERDVASKRVVSGIIESIGNIPVVSIPRVVVVGDDRPFTHLVTEEMAEELQSVVRAPASPRLTIPLFVGTLGAMESMSPSSEPAWVQRQRAHRQRMEDSRRPKRLTGRQNQVDDLVRAGLGSKSIAKKLHISVSAVKRHREQIRKILEG